MFCKLKFRVVFVVLVALSSVCRAQDLSRRLPTETEGLRGDLMENSIWDFSKAWQLSDKGHAVICNYGDSLLAETVDGRRHWYGLQGDTIVYKGEEDRLTVIKLDSAVCVGYRPIKPGNTAVVSDFEGTGMGGGRRFRIMESGTIVSTTAQSRGTLILASGDTLRHILATSERRIFTASFPDDSLSAVTSAVIETCRWYDDEGLTTLMPIAVQRTVYPSLPGGYVEKEALPTFSVAYLPDRSEFTNGDRQNGYYTDDTQTIDTEAIRAALSSASVYCDGRTVTVGLELPESGLTIKVDIMDAGGRLYLHYSTVSTGSSDQLTLDCSSLRAGEYIAAVGVENVEVSLEKQLMIIR